MVESTRRAPEVAGGALVRSSPLVFVEDEFVPPADLQQMIERGARIEDDGGPATKHDTTGFSTELAIDSDPLLSALASAVAARVGFEAPRTSMRFRRYRAGESHPRHHDHFEIGETYLLATAMVTLQGPERGGGTAFPHASPRLIVDARTGRLVLWANHLRDGSPDRLTEHWGEVVEAGEKITVTQFLYGTPADARTMWERLGP